ncbi:MAG TPA: ACP S-malonyltransferase [Thermoleophilaceae bacterium]
MRDLVERRRPDLLALAVELVGADPFERIDAGTAYLQPAIYCTTIASLHAVRALEPDLYAGHSLGELAALAAAGSISEDDGLRLVAARGRLMQRAAEAEGDGAMLAVGAGIDAATELAHAYGLTVANDNSPEQTVLSGPAAAVTDARDDVKARGLRAFRLPIDGAFHSPAMAAALPEFRALLDATEVRPPRRPVFSCVTAQEFDDVRARLAESLVRGVRWREVLLALHARGADRFVEVGPGQVLTKLARATLPGVDALPAEELEAVGA